MKRRLSTRFLMATVLVLALSLIGGSVLAEQLQVTDLLPTGDQPLEAPQVVESYPEPDLPSLTDEDRDRALSIATTHPMVAQLLDKREYSVESVGVWHTKGLDKLGAGIIFSLAQPASFDVEWPDIEYDRSERQTPPYQRFAHRYAAHDVRRLVVMVDLNQGVVVAVTPGPEARRGKPVQHQEQRP